MNVRGARRGAVTESSRTESNRCMVHGTLGSAAESIRHPPGALSVWSSPPGPLSLRERGNVMRALPTSRRAALTYRNAPPALRRTPPALRRTPPALCRTPPALRRTPPDLHRTPPDWAVRRLICVVRLLICAVRFLICVVRLLIGAICFHFAPTGSFAEQSADRVEQSGDVFRATAHCSKEYGH